jgi:hypothetical protein
MTEVTRVTRKSSLMITFLLVVGASLQLEFGGRKKEEGKEELKVIM